MMSVWALQQIKENFFENLGQNEKMFNVHTQGAWMYICTKYEVSVFIPVPRCLEVCTDDDAIVIQMTTHDRQSMIV